MKLTYKGKTYTATTKKGFQCVLQGVKIKEWMDKNSALTAEAAEHFNTSLNSIRRKLKLIGVAVPKRECITLVMVKDGIKEHLETGEITKTAESCGYSKTRLGARMRAEGYSLKDRAYFKVKEVSKVSMQEILCKPFYA